jgi:uncharacterized membrane protein YbhN (UPF0104 family)
MSSNRDHMAQAVALTTLAINDQWDDIEATLKALEPRDWPYLTVALLGFVAAAYTPGAVANLGLQIAGLPE